MLVITIADLNILDERFYVKAHNNVISSALSLDINPIVIIFIITHSTNPAYTMLVMSCNDQTIACLLDHVYFIAIQKVTIKKENVLSTVLL